MRKFGFLFMISLVLTMTTSCHKTWMCECKTGNNLQEVTPIHDVGRMGAKTVCESYAVQNNLKGAHETCNLK